MDIIFSRKTDLSGAKENKMVSLFLNVFASVRASVRSRRW